MSDPYNDIRKRLLAAMILVPLIPFLASLAIGYSSYRASMKRAALELAGRIASDHGTVIDSFLEERVTDLQVILETIGPAELAKPGRLGDVLDSLQHSSTAFIDLGLMDASGIQRAYAGPYDLAGKAYAGTLWFKQAHEKGSYVSDVFLGYRRKPHFVVAVTDEADGQVWTLRATVDQDLFGNLVEGVSIGATGEAFIVNGPGELQTERRTGGALLERDEAYAHASPILERGAGVYKDAVYAMTPLNEGRWRLVVRRDADEALSELDRAALVITLVCLLGCAGIVGLAAMVSGRFVSMVRAKERDHSEMESHLMRAARLAELGEMSAGFAHEINNPLQIMKSEIALMEMEAEEAGAGALGEEFRDGLDQLGKQIDRCAAITRAILKFGRNDKPEKKPLDLAEFIPEVCGMVRRKAEVSGIVFDCDVAPGTPHVVVDAGQLQQVVLNLMNNAVQAIEERHGPDGGLLRVEAGSDGKDRVLIRVEDNGSGISPENLEKIFNPFFTTKPPGKGTGLGLSVCHAIIEAMGGEISATSEPGHGTRFSIVLPSHGGD